MSFAIGIDLGGSSVKAVAVTPAGEMLAHTHVDYDPEARMEWGEKIRGILRQFTAAQGTSPDGIGISAPGLVAKDARSIAVMPGRLNGVERLDWTEFLDAPRVVPVLNDAQAALLGESWQGAARGFRHVIMITLGTGVGGAIISDGKLLHGAFGKGGHLGHFCLDPDGVPDICKMPGSLETAIGNYNIRERSGGRFETTHALVDAHRAGDAGATRVWLKSVRALACAIGSLGNILDPEAVILGGGIAQSGAALFEPLQRFLDEVEWRPAGSRVKLLPAALGDLAGAYGAAFNTLK